MANRSTVPGAYQQTSQPGASWKDWDRFGGELLEVVTNNHSEMKETSIFHRAEFQEIADCLVVFNKPLRNCVVNFWLVLPNIWKHKTYIYIYICYSHHQPADLDMKKTARHRAVGPTILAELSAAPRDPRSRAARCLWREYTLEVEGSLPVTYVMTCKIYDIEYWLVIIMDMCHYDLWYSFIWSTMTFNTDSGITIVMNHHEYD